MMWAMVDAACARLVLEILKVNKGAKSKARLAATYTDRLTDASNQTVHSRQERGNRVSGI